MGIDASSDSLTGVSGGSDLGGYSFQPGAQPWRRRRQGLNQGGLGPRTDEALKIISLRLPEFLGGNPITSPELLGSRPGGAAPGGSVIESNRTAPLPSIPPVNSPAGLPPAGPLTFGGRRGSGGRSGGETSALAQLLTTTLDPPRPHITAALQPGDGDFTGGVTPSPPTVPRSPVRLHRGFGLDAGGDVLGLLDGLLSRRYA
jgi:hypothetical protein